jgi:hypothetical protein
LREVSSARSIRRLSVQRIWQDLRTEDGFTASYYSVLRFVANLRPDAELPFGGWSLRRAPRRR